MKAIKLESERLYMKPLNMFHLSKEYVNWMNDTDVNAYLESGGNYTLESLRLFIEEQERKNILFWAIHTKNDDNHIGNIKIDPIDLNTKSGEYGILIGDKKQWGKGYAKEASLRIIKFCFDDLNLSQITLGVIEQNKRAIELYRGMGFEVEKVIFGSKVYKEELCNSVRMIKLKKTKLILGTVQFGLNYGINNSKGKPSFETVKNILDIAYSKGIKILDTAEAYGDSQEVLGNYHQQSDNKFDIITKYSANRKDLSDDIIERVKTDIETLNVSSLYCYMYHSFDDFILFYKRDKEGIGYLKKKGLIKKFGVSVYTNEEIKKVLETKEVDLIQLPFNLLDNKNLRGNTIQEAKDKGVEIHTRSAFLQGLFFKDTDSLKTSIQPLKENLDLIYDTAKKGNIEIQNLALGYVYNQKNIDNVLIGVDTVEQLEMNIKSVNFKLLDETINNINKIKIKETGLLNPSNW